MTGLLWYGVPMYVLLLSSHISLGFPNDQQKHDQQGLETPTTEGLVVKDNDELTTEFDELPLQDQMDKYNDVPYIIGNVSDCECGMPLQRIVGGENAEIAQYPWTALLYSVESERYKIPYCGGALINNQYVLTASHCVDGLDPNKIEVVLREQNVSMNTDENDMPLYITRSMVPGGTRNTISVLRIGVDRVIQHSQYSRRTLDNDIALIRLKVRIPLVGLDIAPVCVPRDDALFSQGVYATVAGYGAISEAGVSALTLQMAEVRVLSNELCNTPNFHNGKITENMLCADGMGKGPCAGDTGGPLMIRSSRYSARQVLAGIASWSSTCLDPTRPAVYTRVPMYESWILQNTQDARWCAK